MTQRFLKTLGFEPATSAETQCLPNEKPLKCLVLARETLVNKVQSKVEGTEMSDIDTKLGFPTFQS